MRQYILTLLPNYTEAEDVLAETNMSIWEQFDENDEPRDFRAWACTIAYYQVLTRRKQLARRGKVLSDELIDLLASEAVEHLERPDQRIEALRTCLEKLNQAHRELIQKYYSGGWKLEEIAQTLGHTTAAVKTRISRIRRKLHLCIESQFTTEDLA